MSKNTPNVSRKTLIVVVLAALLTTVFIVYDFPQLINTNLTKVAYSEHAYVDYYYDPQVPQEEQRVVCIVFDDGWLTQYTNALPILEEHGFKATFSIITDYPDKNPSYMDWKQIVALHDQGHDIESHTADHSILTLQNESAIEYQLSQSKQDLLKHGINAPLFIYPNGEGAGNSTVESLVQQNYCAARGIIHGNIDMNQPFNPYALPAYEVRNSTTLEMFKNYVNQANGSNIVIIFYHQISDGSVYTSATIKDFADQMQYLSDNNFEIKTLKQLFTSIEV
ncbi:MAG: polysaccharide deacetylase family protein [Candidatus Bathyarchaeota archaeon]|nr:polysaccharide deacetylase family protein [Candidatus Termiticorpusculum sp.]